MRHIILSIILLAFFPMAGYADAVKIGGIYYNLVSKAKTAEVTSNPNKYSGSVVIPSSVTYNGTTYSVTSIGEEAFDWCYELASVSIPNSVKSIGYCAFSHCHVLTSVNIPNSVISIDSEAFGSCRSLTSIIIPNSVTSIGGFAFSGCSGLTCVSIPNSVTSMGNGVFSDCSGLTSVTIPNSVTTIGDQFFYGCSGLVSVTIPNSVTSIGSSAFYGCSGLTSISIPNSVTSIYGSAFSGCSGLTTVTIGSGIKYIYSSAFEKCRNLVDVYCLAESVPSTNSEAFKDSYPEYITLHVLGKSIDTYKTKEPWNLFKKIVDLSTPSDGEIGESYNGVEINGIIYNLIGKSKSAEVTSNPNKYSGSVVIPSSVTYNGTTYSVTSIGEEAFDWCYELASVSIPNSVKSIGYCAFSHCHVLTSVNIPNSVISIDSEAFGSCRSLTSIIIPNSVTSIGGFAFSGCSGLTCVSIPNSVTSMGNGVFSDCSGLTSVTIPNSVTTIGDQFFYGCSGLVSVTIPNSVTSIGSSAFYGCSGLTSISIPNSVTSIYGSAFSGCSGLTTVTIGSGIKYIYSSAFEKCRNLVDVYCLAESVPSTNSEAFKDSYPKYITLHVPGKSIDAYKAKEPWSKFMEVLALDGTAMAKISVGSQGEGTYSFDHDLDFSGVSGIEAYVVCGFNPGNGQVLMTRIHDVPAGTGLFVKTTNGKAGEFTVPTKKSYSYYMNMFKPVFAATTVPTAEDDFTNYVLINGIFTKSNGSVQVAANSAYIQLPNRLSSIQSLSMSFDDAVLLGDANNDGKVNVADIVAITNYRKGLAPAGFNDKAADLNNDSEVDDIDISILVKMIMDK